MTKPEQAGLLDKMAKILALETDPDGVRYCLLIRNEHDNVTAAIGFGAELRDLVKLFESTCMEVIEAGRVDGMFIEWNSLNLADIGLMKEALTRLLGRGEGGNNG